MIYIILILIVTITLIIPFYIEIVFENNKLKYNLYISIMLNTKLKGLQINIPINKNISQTNNESTKIENMKKLYNNRFILYSLIKYLLKKVKIKKLIWITKIGLGDAALTGIISGWLWWIKSSVVTLIINKNKKDIIIDINPDFNKINIETHFNCIIKLKLVYIIIAGINGIRTKLKGGVC